MRHPALACLLLSLAPPALAGQDPPITLTRGLFVDRVVRAGRDLVRFDPIAQSVASGAFRAPAAGDAVAGGDRTWTVGSADDHGWFDAALGRSGYGYFEVTSPRQRVAVLDALAHAMIYVDGEPRMGDPYAGGAVSVPVRLRAGVTPLLVAMGGRAPFRAVLREPRAPVELDARDTTLPDLLEGDDVTPVWAGIVLRNCTIERQTVRVEARAEGAGDWRFVRDLTLEPLATTKPALTLPGTLPATGDTAGVELRARVPGLEGEDIAKLALRVRRPDQSRRVVYHSTLDGSVQYYAVVPPLGEEPPGMVLSLHGASVEATGQADSYARKPGLWIVCPTNRRPFGFDWESFGREDALSVLQAAAHRFRPDPSRTYLTGHSMGGHGSWQLATLFPDRFAAVAPSAGWISFESYAEARGDAPDRGDQDPIRLMLRRAACTSDTLAHVSNLASMGVFILHGDADDNVPVGEARRMGEVLGVFHRDWRTHEEPGAGHWWDSGRWKDHAGAACVDFPPIFDFFAARRLPRPGEVRLVDFVTSNPAVSGECHWAGVVAQERRLRPSRLVLDFDPASRRVRGTTDNVRAMTLSPDLRGERGLSLTLDGQDVTLDAAGPIVIHRLGGRWEQGPPIAPIPPGSFVDAYAGFVFVYGTGGSPEESAQALAHARYDAEQWWVRGNGSARVLSDRAYLAMQDPPIVSMLYGGEDTNLAWAAVLPDAQVRVRRGVVSLGSREITGSAGVLAVQRGRDGGPVGVIAGTDLPGARTLERLPLFVSGVGVPEVVVVRPDLFTRGEGAIVACGFLGNDWGVESGEIHFRDQTGRR
ncbi:MAG: hypothetical protein FJ255_04995 [Phycisphaerae bacterium]|nr:hypothetical protein [Phycisphaerae bacterium]